MSIEPPSAASPRPEGVNDPLRALFGELASGRVDALGPIYDRCADRLYTLALWRTGSPADADDVLQEVFVRLAARRLALGDVRDPFAYLATATHRAAIDVHRRRERRGERPLEDCSYLRAPDASPDRNVDAARASRLLADIPPAQREAIYLHHYCELSFAEVGRITEVTKFTAASRYRLGMKRLRKLMRLDT